MDIGIRFTNLEYQAITMRGSHDNLATAGHESFQLLANEVGEFRGLVCDLQQQLRDLAPGPRRQEAPQARRQRRPPPTRRSSRSIKQYSENPHFKKARTRIQRRMINEDQRCQKP